MRRGSAPVRQLVAGPDALITDSDYQSHRSSTQKVVARVSPVHSTDPWVFFAIAGSSTGAPRWMLLDGASAQPTLGLDRVSQGLRHHLGDNPDSRAFDVQCDEWLNRYLEAATKIERQLLPRRMQRALEQMARLTAHWAAGCHRSLDTETSRRWQELNSLSTVTGEEQFDTYLLAERWLSLVQPHLDAVRRERRHSRYLRLQHVEHRLRERPLPIDQVEEALSGLPLTPPLANRITACILGVPATSTSTRAAALA